MYDTGASQKAGMVAGKRRADTQHAATPADADARRSQKVEYDYLYSTGIFLALIRETTSS